MERIVQHLAQAIPGVKIRNIERIYNSVSGAVLSRAEVEGPYNGSVVVKIHSDVGRLERTGAERIRPFMAVPPEVGLPFKDCYVHKFIPGMTLDEAVKKQVPNAAQIFRDFTDVNLRMWEATKSEAKPPDHGYSFKVEETQERVMGYTLGGKPVKEVMDLPLILNGTSLPCITQIFSDIKSCLASLGHTVLTHGDEGAGNGIYTKTGKIFVIDHGTAGLRYPVEPIAKLLLWFPVTDVRGELFSCEVRRGHLIIDYRVIMCPFITALVKKINKYIHQESDVVTLYSDESLSAAVALYIFRELNWIAKRGREIMAVYLFGMALESASGMYCGLAKLPLIS